METNHLTPHSAPAASLAGFSPVPLRARYDGFTPERQRDFIQTLAETGQISRACAAANVSRELAYRVRRRPDATAFAAAWDAALALAVQLIADLAMEYALEGEVIQTFYRGEVIAERIKRDTRLWMFLLAAHDPAKYGRQPAGEPANRMKSARRSYAVGLEALTDAAPEENSS